MLSSNLFLSQCVSDLEKAILYDDALFLLSVIILVVNIFDIQSQKAHFYELRNQISNKVIEN